ncbi:hypothetical protein FB45DRAFT_557025 [Roridomyces roridus]|uniref:K Homology domain-containing protein n=1 Tax=Roridomyces roridus TaxID=1738132 RepID=A0AAD7FLG7_9AGAR|nr:hypothetical protein FB45DRAFT_557025 [Roridomyces roridus]
MEKQWSWPSLSTIEAHERDSKTSTEKFHLNPREAFLILGKDGADLRDLSIKYNAHIEYQQNPLALLATGPTGSLKKLAAHIEHLRATMSEEIFEVPMHESIQSHVLRRISRISGAFTQDFGPGKIRVSFNGSDPRAAGIARRLSARAVSEGSYANKPQLFFHLPPSVASSSPVPVATTYPNIYSLYPFLSPRDLPWTAGASGVFRLRRVEEWFGTGASENLNKTGGLVMGRGHTITLQQQDVDLRELLRVQPAPGTSRTVVASVGHVLLTSPPAQQMNIVPPLSGNFKLPQLLEWMTGRPKPALFIPSVPLSVLEAQPSHHQMLHRLVYHAVGGDDSRNTIKVELDLQEPFHSTCWLGQSAKLDMMIPDRPADIQFTIFDSRVLDSPQYPPMIEDYITSLRSFLSYQVREATQPETPLTFEHEGLTYVLHSNSSVRQNTQQLEATDTPSLQVVTESVLDLDADQKSTSCQVICNDLDSEDTWKSFMSVCDEITTATAPVMSTPAQDSTPIE